MKQDSITHPQSDAFDHFLMKQLQQNQPYLADDNFTAKIMESLPAPRKLSQWQERLIILVPLIIISLLVLSQFSVVAIFIKLWILAVGMNVAQLLQIGFIVSVTIISGASLWFARQSRLI